MRTEDVNKEGMCVLAGVSLVADAARGPNFLTATSTGLLPGTNYTVLASVRLSGGSSSSSQAASPTVLALTGLLVPDTAPPSFTTAVVRAVAPGVVGSNGSSSTAGATTFSIQMDLALNEDARVYYAVYGDPACITGAVDVGRMERLAAHPFVGPRAGL